MRRALSGVQFWRAILANLAIVISCEIVAMARWSFILFQMSALRSTAARYLRNIGAQLGLDFALEFGPAQGCNVPWIIAHVAA